jgi:hypothetical protein
MKTDAQKEWMKEYYAKNRDRLLAQSKVRYEQKKEQILQRQKESYREKKNDILERNKSWRSRNQDIVRSKDFQRHLRNKFKLTQKEFERMWESQGGICDVDGCGTVLRRGKGGYAIDHCHRTGRIRGMLCVPCNVVLGRVWDDVVRLDGLASYLRKHGHGQ